MKRDFAVSRRDIWRELHLRGLSVKEASNPSGVAASRGLPVEGDDFLASSVFEQ